MALLLPNLSTEALAILETQVASGHPILERLPRTDSRATLEIAVVLRCVLFVALSAARVLQAASWSCVPGSFRAKVPGGNLMRRRYGVTTKLEQKGQLYAIAASRDARLPVRYQQQAYPSARAQSAIARTSFFRAGDDGSALNDAYPTRLTGVRSFVVDNT